MWTIWIRVVAHERLLPAGFARVDQIVVKTLGDEDRIKEAKVDGQDDHGRHQARPDGTEEIGDIAYEPNGQERQRNAFCRAAFVVFNQLRDLCMGISRVTGYLDMLSGRTYKKEHPRSQRDGSKYARDCFVRGQLSDGHAQEQRPRHIDYSQVTDAFSVRACMHPAKEWCGPATKAKQPSNNNDVASSTECVTGSATVPPRGAGTLFDWKPCPD